MAAVLPIAYVEVLKTLNLQSDIGLEDLFTRHEADVQLFLNRYCDSDIYSTLYIDAIPAEIISKSFTLAYCYLMLSSTIEFMNLNTLGKGVIRATGMDSNKTELLGHNEIESIKKSLELKALVLIYSYLSGFGQDYYESISKTRKRTMRFSLI